MEKYIKTFEDQDHSTNTHIVDFKDLTNWSADRVVNNNNGKFSYLKIDNEWIRKDLMNRTEQSKAIWMSEEEAIELNNLYNEYKEISDRYQGLVNSYKPSKVTIPENRIW